MNNTYEECIQACLDCIKACNYDACLNEEDVKMMVPCIRMDRECSDICTFSVKSMETNSLYNKSAKPVPVEMNANNLTTNTAKHVQKHAAKWLRNTKKPTNFCKLRNSRLFNSAYSHLGF